MTITPAHEAKQTHHYFMHFPEHPARESDPHYADFNAYHRKTRPTARCYIGERLGFAECRDAQGNPCTTGADGEMTGLELHHAVIEFSLQNGVDLKALEVDYPGVSDTTDVGAWIESAESHQLRWLCAWHHRGAAGAHTASHSDWSASQYVHNLIS